MSTVPSAPSVSTRRGRGFFVFSTKSVGRRMSTGVGVVGYVPDLMKLPVRTFEAAATAPDGHRFRAASGVFLIGRDGIICSA